MGSESNASGRESGRESGSSGTIIVLPTCIFRPLELTSNGSSLTRARRQGSDLWIRRGLYVWISVMASDTTTGPASPDSPPARAADADGRELAPPVSCSEYRAENLNASWGIPAACWAGESFLPGAPPRRRIASWSPAGGARNGDTAGAAVGLGGWLHDAPAKATRQPTSADMLESLILPSTAQPRTTAVRRELACIRGLWRRDKVWWRLQMCRAVSAAARGTHPHWKERTGRRECTAHAARFMAKRRRYPPHVVPAGADPLIAEVHGWQTPHNVRPDSLHAPSSSPRAWSTISARRSAHPELTRLWPPL